jgi:hypothetical protein
MNIILGETALQQLGDKYITLELDTITIGDSAPVKAYCVIETIPIPEFPKTASLKKMHATLMEEYRNRNWGFCEQAIEHLYGSWNNELDTFYSDLLQRVATYKEKEPDQDWTGIIAK